MKRIFMGGALGALLMTTVASVAVADVPAQSPAQSPAQPAPAKPEITVIHAGHVITEPGKPVLENQSIVIENGKIADIRPGFVSGDRVIDLKDAYVLPGLFDMHTHVTLVINMSDPMGSIMKAGVGRQAPFVFESLPRVKQILHNGFTTIRNLGDPTEFTYDLRDAINKGLVDGPRILGVEPQFTVSGGDYDAFAVGVKPEAEPFFQNRGTCNGVVDCRRAVREEVHRGADVIKLRMAAQAFLDPKVGAIEYADEVNAIVETAHKLNRTVAAHSNSSAEGNRMIIEAGVDSIEHGPVGVAEIKLMRQRGTALTPTLVANENAKELIKNILKDRNIYQEDIDSARNAYKAGVPILYGTDLGLYGPERQHDEFILLVKQAGLTTADALRAATINAARVLKMDDRLGSLEKGKVADVVAVRGNPLADIAVMKSVVFVMKEGKVYRQDPASSH